MVSVKNSSHKKNNNGRPWTQADIAELKAVIKKGERIYREAQVLLDKIRAKQALKKIDQMKQD